MVGSVSVEARGKMTFGPPEVRPGPYITCRDLVVDWVLTNPSGGEAGIGELTSLTASGCSSFAERHPTCTGASVEIKGLPQRAPLRQKRFFPLAVELEGMSMRAQCGTYEIPVRRPLEALTRGGLMRFGEGGGLLASFL
jgi:hypothetical protein